MCNLSSLTKGQAAIRDLARARRDSTGNLPPLPGIFPDQMAPVVRTARDGERELAMMRWGLSAGGQARRAADHQRAQPRKRLLARLAQAGVPLRRAGDELLRVRRAPFQAADLVRARGGQAALRLRRRVATLDRHAGHQGRAEHLLYAFLTTDANADVAPVHPKAMPVLLRTAEEIGRWLTAPTEDALELQRPLPDGTLEIVAVGQRQDGSGSPVLE